jgi:CheY-like chemotaxis protein
MTIHSGVLMALSDTTMSENYKIAIVEDESIQRVLLSKVLGKHYEVLAFESGEAFLEAMPQVDIVLLDIEMPGLSGFETCQRLRADFEIGETPVIFVSAHDSTEERVAAYEAGGDDFLVKPLNMDELQHKVGHFVKRKEREQSLAAQSSFAQKTAFSAMSSMGELGVVLDFMRRSFSCNSYTDVADALVTALSAYDLRGSIQIRGAYGVHDHVSDEAYNPLQTSVVEVLAKMGRIVQFRSRMIINYEQVSLLIHNLPMEDEERVGRLRDHLASLTEGANARVKSIDTAASLLGQQKELAVTLREIRETMQRASLQALDNRNRSQDVMQAMSTRIEHEFSGMGLTEQQERRLLCILHDAGAELLSLFDGNLNIERTLDAVIRRMELLIGVGNRNSEPVTN